MINSVNLSMLDEHLSAYVFMHFFFKCMCILPFPSRVFFSELKKKWMKTAIFTK